MGSLKEKKKKEGLLVLIFKEEYPSKIKKKDLKKFLKENLCYLNWSPVVTW